MGSDELSKEERLTEIARMAEDPFEFLKYVRIQEPGELSLKYELWPHLVDFFQNFERYKLLDVVKAKQIGVSWALAIHALRNIMSKRGWEVLEISKGKNAAQDLLYKSKIIYHNFPQWLRNEFTPWPDSTEHFGFKETRSKITALPSLPDAGIGTTAGLVIHDEAYFHDFFITNLSHTRATVADADDRQLISVSTLDKTRPDNGFKEHCENARDGRNGFKLLFYGFDARPDRDEEFRRLIEQENEYTPWVVEGNYPRTLKEALSPLGAQSCFNVEVLQKLWDDSETMLPTRKNYIYIIHPPRVGVFYAAGVDVGEGVGLDYSCLTVIGKDGLRSEVAAIIYSNQIGTDVFAFDCNEVCSEYFNPPMVVDNIGIGRAVIDGLIRLGYPNLYMMNEKKYGFALNRTNTRELVAKLVEGINNSSLKTKFRPQIQELQEYQWVKGYPEPLGKTHGDTVTALMLAASRLDNLGTSQKAPIYVGGKRIN